VNFLSKTKPAAPGVTIRNVLGEEIDYVAGVWDLTNAELSHRQWQHANPSGLSLDGANCEGINLFGARLVKTSFSRCDLRNAELSFSDATSAKFSNANLDDCLMYRVETRFARFDGATISEASEIPGIKVVENRTIDSAGKSESPYYCPSETDNVVSKSSLRGVE
jgi:uncharacterized protein YjbI with pentapeptide repeats